MRIPAKIPSGSRLIALSQGRFALVDEDDYERASQYKWSYHKSDGYAVRMEGTPGGRRMVQLHRFILGADDPIVDHVSGSTLDCRKSNLRGASASKNQRNKGKRNNTSGYKGVSWNTEKSKYSVEIQVDGKTTHLGYYDDAKEAARAYDAEAKKLHGDFARLNFGEDDE